MGNEDLSTLEYFSKIIGNTQVSMTLETGSVAQGESTSQAHGHSVTHTRGTSTSRSSSISSGSSMTEGLSYSESGGFKSSHTHARSNSWNSGVSASRTSNQSSSMSSTSGSSQSTSRGETTTDTTGQSWTQTRGLNQSIQKTALLPPEEIRLRFSKHEMLVLVKGERPFSVRPAHYYDDPFFTALYDPHPHHTPPPERITTLTVHAPTAEIARALFERGKPFLAGVLAEGTEINKNTAIALLGALEAFVRPFCGEGVLYPSSHVPGHHLAVFAPVTGIIETVETNIKETLNDETVICTIRYDRRQAFLESHEPYLDAPQELAYRLQQNNTPPVLDQPSNNGFIMPATLKNPKVLLITAGAIVGLWLVMLVIQNWEVIAQTLLGLFMVLMAIVGIVLRVMFAFKHGR